MKAILTFRGSRIDIQSKEVTIKKELMMASICNGKWEGGSFLVAPDADLSDGKLDILCIEKVPALLLISYLLRFRWGPASWMKGIKAFRTESVELASTVPMAVHRDGEHLGTDIRHLKFTVEKNALRVLTTKNYWI